MNDAVVTLVNIILQLTEQTRVQQERIKQLEAEKESWTQQQQA